MRTTETYLVAHLGAGVDVKAKVVVGQFGRLLLQLPGEGNFPEKKIING